MSTMNGNPHYQAVRHHQDCGNALTPTVNATLALAYEQRTANLIAAFDTGGWDERNDLKPIIAARLGLRDESAS